MATGGRPLRAGDRDCSGRRAQITTVPRQNQTIPLGAPPPRVRRPGALQPGGASGVEAQGNTFAGIVRALGQGRDAGRHTIDSGIGSDTGFLGQLDELLGGELDLGLPLATAQSRGQDGG